MYGLYNWSCWPYHPLYSISCTFCYKHYSPHFHFNVLLPRELYFFMGSILPWRASTSSSCVPENPCPLLFCHFLSMHIFPTTLSGYAWVIRACKKYLFGKWMNEKICYLLYANMHQEKYRNSPFPSNSLHLFSNSFEEPVGCYGLFLGGGNTWLIILENIWALTQQ